MWVPNWPSTAVTCGISGQWPWDMIVGRGMRLLYLIFRQVIAWLGLLAQRTIEERGNPRAAPRGRRVTPPGE